MRRKSEIEKKLEEITPEELASVYLKLFSSSEGQLVLEDLKNRCYVYSTTNGDEILEGRRQVFLHIDTQMNYESDPKEEITDAIAS